MKRLFVGLALAVAASAFADAPEPYIWWKMDRVVDGKVPNDGTNTDARCNLTLGPAVAIKNVYGVENALYFDASTAVSKESWATSWTPALKSRTVAFWICRDADDSKFDPAVNKTHYVFNGLSRESIMLATSSLGMNVKLGARENTSEEIAHSYFYSAGNFTRDAWHLIVIVLEDTGETSAEEGAYFGNPVFNLHVYQDGVLHKTVMGRVTEAGLDVEGPLTVGNSAANQTRTFPGALSDIRIYDCALTANDVTDLWNADLPSHGPKVLGFWRMEEIETDAGGVRMVADASGFGVPLTVGEKNEIMQDAGVSGNALDFTDWAQNYGVAKNKSALIRDFSVSLWMRPKKGMDKLQTEGHVGNKLPHVFLFAGYYRCAFGNIYDAYTNLNLFDLCSVTNSLISGQNIANAYLAKGLWSHFAFVAKAEQDAGGRWWATPKCYCNGKLVFTGRPSTCPGFESKGVYPDTGVFLLGNSGYPNQARAMWGQMDDVAFFGSALTDEDVRRLYQGVPEVDAGTDFTVVGESARLAGSLSLNHGGACDRAACLDSAVWSLVSAPEGAAATIAAPDDLTTGVTLPVEGTYVFRLTASLVGISVHDEVTVTRVATSGGASPTLVVTAPATAVSAAPIALSASTAGGAAPVRVFWSKVSGPGAVGFEPKEGERTAATFHEAGDYVVRATADDGERKVSQDAAISVTASEAVSLTSGLIGYWPLGGSKRDEVSMTVFDNTHYSQAAEVCPGVDGYGTRVNAINDKTLYSGVTLRETPLYPDATEANKNTVPKDRWRAFSMWIRYDPQADTNGACNSVLAEARYTLGLFYDRTNGTDRIAMYQQTMYSPIGGMGNLDYYTASVPPFDNRWVHVYAAFDRQTGWETNESELWIDGVRQSNRTVHGMGGGRIQTSQCLQFGNINAANGTAGPNDRWANMPRTFPGSLDEIRLYDRKLSEAEIRFLAANPVVDVNHAPTADVVTVPADAVRGELAAVAAVTADDGLPVGSSLTGSWVVLSGGAENLVFVDASARETQAKALKAGSYTVAYKVCDGEKTTYSDPKTYVVGKSGTILFLR